MIPDAAAADVPRAARRAVPAVLVLAVPVASFAGALALRPTLPDRVASHWGADGRPDGFSGPLELPVIGLVVGVVAAVLAAAVLPRLGDTLGRRVVGGLLGGVPAAFAALGVLGDVAQTGPGAVSRGLAWWVLPTGLATAFAVGLLVALAVPGVPRTPAAEGPAPDAPRVAASGWEGRAGAPRVVPLLALPVLVVAGVGVWSAAHGGGWGLAIGLGVLLLVVDLLAAAMLFVRVRVDASGVVVAPAVPLLSALRLRIALEEVVEARVVDVNPLTQFGGWGYRVGPGRRSGFVLRAGEALEVLRGNGSRFVVTVDDAATAAGVVNHLLDARTPVR